MRSYRTHVSIQLWLTSYAFSADDHSQTFEMLSAELRSRSLIRSDDALKRSQKVPMPWTYRRTDERDAPKTLIRDESLHFNRLAQV
jgi:hypothetical protein